MVSELKQRFALISEDVYEMSALLDYTTLFEIAGLEVESAALPAVDAAASNRARGRGRRHLCCHPSWRHPFAPSLRQLLRRCRTVHSARRLTTRLTVSIKMTVYRVGDDTPFVKSLIRAAEAGKQVACVIELNARFDEERNLHWSRELENVGAHVMFGVTGLKTHSKAALVVRKEEAACAATRTSQPATTTRARPGCTRMSGC